MEFAIYRFVPGHDARPRMERYALALEPHDRMLLDALERIRATQDETLAYRRSCREGVCGSDGMNINGRNGLACITPLRGLREPVTLRPLPGFPVVRDLVVDLTRFFEQYRSIRPYVIDDTLLPERERLQSPEERARLDSLYECILCACCSGFCPSYWWNPERFLGPATLLQALRFIADSRDRATAERLDYLNEAYRLFRCRGIMNCTEVCPKGLNPARAIELIKLRMVREEL